MADNKNIFIQDTGKVILKLDKILKEKNVSVAKLATEARIQYKQAKSYCDGNMQKVDLLVLAKICHTLRCKIPDVLEYIPPKDEK